MLPTNESMIADAAKSLAESVRRFVELLERAEKAIMAKLEEDKRRMR